MGVYRKLSRWPHYLDCPEVLEMDGREYAAWYRENVLFAPGLYAEHRARRDAETPEQRRERRARTARAAAFVGVGALKVAAFVGASLVGATFVAARDTQDDHTRM